MMSGFLGWESSATLPEFPCTGTGDAELTHQYRCHHICKHDNTLSAN